MSGPHPTRGATRDRTICAADQVQEAGAGFRFEVRSPDGVRPAFAIRYQGVVRAYLNRCAHMALELDLIPGRLFDNERRYLMCSTHGARYEPASGRCVFGPCRGGQLQTVRVCELDRQLVLTDNDYQLVEPSHEAVNERKQ